VDFFGQQQRMRRRTGMLVVLYALAVLGITLLVYVVFLLVAGANGAGAGWFQPELFGAVVLGTLLVVGSASLYKIAALSGGGRTVAEMLGGRLVPRSTRDPDEQKLLNVVEEMAIASGVPVPQVYVMDGEESINAFAAGYRPNDAVLGVTRGCLQQLDRDELQGVIGHEFSHVLNGDMRLNIRLIGVLFGITCISTAGYLILRSAGRVRSGKRNGAAGAALLGLGLLIVGWLGSLFASLIRAAVSRQREFLADASAVQFTRNPNGIGSALKKIGGFPVHGKVRNAHAGEASHMFFADVMAGFSSLFATHPPIEARIRAIDKNWQAVRAQARADAEVAAAGAVPGLAGFAAGAAPITPARVVGSVGQLEFGSLSGSQELLRRLPLGLAAAVRDPFGARAVVLGLLLPSEPAARDRQFARLAAALDPQTHHEIALLQRDLRALELAARLPLIELAIPALREMSHEQYDRFRSVLAELVAADQQLEPFELAVERMLRRHLDATFGRARPPRVEHRTLHPVLAEVGLALSALARHTERPAAAYAAGAQLLAPLPLPPLRHDPAPLADVDRALDALARLAPPAKARLLQAAAAIAAQDGVVAPKEGELLRAIADGLDCPLPPLFAGRREGVAAERIVSS
jgi:Zn-dependent protease with chaperone function